MFAVVCGIRFSGGAARAEMHLRILQKQLGHKHIEKTMRYATFHPGYNDVAPHFGRMGRMLGLYEGRGEAATEEVPGDTLGDTPLDEPQPTGTENG